MSAILPLAHTMSCLLYPVQYPRSMVTIPGAHDYSIPSKDEGMSSVSSG